MAKNGNEKNHGKGLVLVSEIYPDHIAVLPLDNRPLFPGLTLPVSFRGEVNVKKVKDAVDNNKAFVGVSMLHKDFDPQEHNGEPGAADLYHTGTLLKVIKIIGETETDIHFVAQALTRFQYIRSARRRGLQVWQVQYDYEEQKISQPEAELKAYTLAVINSVKELIRLNPMFQEQMKIAISQVGMEKPGLLMDLVASFLTVDGEKLQELLETFDLYERSEKLLLLLKEEIELSQLQQEIHQQIEEKVTKQQREFFLREQLKFIKKELGLEKDEKSSEIEKITQRLQTLKLSEEAKKVVDEELEKLKTLEPASAEYNVSRTYLNWITDLPWGIFSTDNKDLAKARIILDEQHYGLEDVKNRILEFIATIIKKGKVSGSIICLTGPPGVGKTSIGRSIAEALNRRFYRFSVGGMRDEAEIKGHRRTYIGAMPGKLIQSLKRTGVSNPVIMLDEIDKLGASFQGDPAAALLEVLDPEQNKDFLDHYLDIRYDLSNILFITTANQLDTIPRPLLDRMEIIQLPGYIPEEKIEIARRYLIPRQRKEHGLKAGEIVISRAALRKIVDGYAREAGVRGLENQIRKIMRKATLDMAEKGSRSIRITGKNLPDWLGEPLFTSETLYRKPVPGVAPGLAWTAYGGATLFVEATALPGNGPALKQTGQLGKVMLESSEIAFSYVRSFLDQEFKEFFDKNQIHIHVPAGATPKDGPSAGITIATALCSLASGVAVKEGIAMTGELTLTGRVLPIGGVREKTIAARRAGIRELIFPSDNRKDFNELPDYLKEGLTVHFVDYFREVADVALPGMKLKRSKRI